MSLLAIAGGLVAGGFFVQHAMGLFPPLLVAWQKHAHSLMPNVNPQVAELVEMRHREIITESEYLKMCREFGFDSTISGQLFQASTNLLTIYDYITLWRREKLSESELDKKLKETRLNSAEIQRAKDVTLFFPSPGDLVRFAVREVYTPAIVSKFGMLQDLPDMFISESRKAGLPEDQAKNFWASHWELPSPRMGFEMLHRRIIDDDTLKLLLKALDVMPFWRDSMIKLSYNPLTRVDVRRMYRLGVLNETEITDSYLDLGYSPENAARMTRFTVAYETDELTGVTRASVMSAFKKGIVTIEQLQSYLVDFGYSEDVVSFWLSMAVYDQEAAKVDLIVTELKAQYKSGMSTIDQVRNQLVIYDLPATYISKIVGDLKLQESEKVRLPSKADLEAWIKIQAIDELEYFNRMTMIGYTQEDITMYLTQMALELDIKKPKYLPIGTYSRWFIKGIINEMGLSQILYNQGYKEDHINKLITELQSQKAVKLEG
ncbi:hypothetical protein ES703_48965 [subsurface metagenome]